MPGVIANSMERTSSMDRAGLAQRLGRIFRTTFIHDNCRQRRILGNHRHSPHVGHLAEQSMGGKPANRGLGGLHDLVLERAAHLAKSASKLAIRCYSKLGFNDIYPVHHKITDERGT